MFLGPYLIGFLAPAFKLDTMLHLRSVAAEPDECKSGDQDDWCLEIRRTLKEGQLRDPFFGWLKNLRRCLW